MACDFIVEIFVAFCYWHTLEKFGNFHSIPTFSDSLNYFRIFCSLKFGRNSIRKTSWIWYFLGNETVSFPHFSSMETGLFRFSLFLES